jgi:threonine dehydrogenase-like Zn-dependent dehydrogenase
MRARFARVNQYAEMRAVAVLPATGELRLVDRPEAPVLGPSQVRVRVLDVGICGTDREIACSRYGTPPPGRSELIIGHEALGQVVETGALVKRLEPGDLVVPTVRRPCAHPTCAACRARRPDFCASGDYAECGVLRADGFLIEQFIEEEEYLHAIPSELRQVGVLVEPLSLAEKAIAQYWNIQSRLPWLQRGEGHALNAVVLGAGPVGLLGCMVLVSHGFRTTVVSRGDGPDPRSNFADSIGATFLSADRHSPDEIAEQLGAIDLVYEATGASVLAFKMLERFGTNGVFILTGVPGRKAPVELDSARVMRNLVLKNQLVFASVAAAQDDYLAAVQDLALFRARWPDALASFISGRYPVENFRELLRCESKDMKEVLSFESA